MATVVEATSFAILGRLPLGRYTFEMTAALTTVSCKMPTAAYCAIVVECCELDDNRLLCCFVLNIVN